MTRHAQGVACICTGLIAAAAAIWLAILAPKPKPGEFNTVNHKPLVVKR